MVKDYVVLKGYMLSVKYRRPPRYSRLPCFRVLMIQRWGHEVLLYKDTCAGFGHQKWMILCQFKNKTRC
jgi:hypothetical protein